MYSPRSEASGQTVLTHALLETRVPGEVPHQRHGGPLDFEVGGLHQGSDVGQTVQLLHNGLAHHTGHL